MDTLKGELVASIHPGDVPNCSRWRTAAGIDTAARRHPTDLCTAFACTRCWLSALSSGMAASCCSCCTRSHTCMQPETHRVPTQATAAALPLPALIDSQLDDLMAQCQPRSNAMRILSTSKLLEGEPMLAHLHAAVLAPGGHHARPLRHRPHPVQPAHRWHLPSRTPQTMSASKHSGARLGSRCAGQSFTARRCLGKSNGSIDISAVGQSIQGP